MGGIEQQLEQPLLALPESYHGLIACMCVFVCVHMRVLSVCVCARARACVRVLSTLLQMTTSGPFMYIYSGQSPDM